LLSNGGTLPLPTLPPDFGPYFGPPTHVLPAGINDAGDVVGSIYFANTANEAGFIWNGSSYTFLPSWPLYSLVIHPYKGGGGFPRPKSQTLPSRRVSMMRLRSSATIGSRSRGIASSSVRLFSTVMGATPHFRSLAMTKS
jgi:hypothetical protein